MKTVVTQDLMKKAIACLEAPPPSPAPNALPKEDECDLFGRLVAVELRQIEDDRKRNMAKLKIQTFLFESRFDQTIPVTTRPTPPAVATPSAVWPVYAQTDAYGYQAQGSHGYNSNNDYNHTTWPAEPLHHNRASSTSSSYCPSPAPSQESQQSTHSNPPANTQ